MKILPSKSRVSAGIALRMVRFEQGIENAVADIRQAMQDRRVTDGGTPYGKGYIEGLARALTILEGREK